MQQASECKSAAEATPQRRCGGRPERNAVAFSLVATYRRVNGRSVAMNVSVCLSVRENISEIICQIFASFFSVAMTRYSSGGIGM